jgi:hypothetical protein
MTNALKAKPYAEDVASTGAAGMILDGRYLPPPQDKDGKIWVRTSALIQVDTLSLYKMWRDVEAAPPGKNRLSRSL